MKTTKKLYGMDGAYDEPEKPMVYRNDAQKYDLYPNPASNTLIRKPGNSIDKLLKSRPMTEQDRLDLIKKPTPTNRIYPKMEARAATPQESLEARTKKTLLTNTLNKFKK